MSTTRKIEGEQTPLPTTRAEEIAGEGPYTIKEHRPEGLFTVEGPTFSSQTFHQYNRAESLRTELNAAYNQGQQDTQPSQTEDLEARAREWLRTEQNTAETDDLRTNGKEVAFICAAFARTIAQPSAPTVDQITLEGEQSDPCGTITVKVRMSDGREVEAIRTNANSIYHMVTLADPAFGK